MSRFCVRELGRRDDLVGERQHQLGELRLVELRFAQLLERGRRRARSASPTRRLVRRASAALAAAVGVVGLLQRVHEPAQVVVGVVGDVRRHLRVAEIGLARAMRRWCAARGSGASCRRPTGRGTAGCAPAPGRAALRRVTASSSVGELAPRLGVHASTSTGSARQMSSSQVMECSKAADGPVAEPLPERPSERPDA